MKINRKTKLGESLQLTPRVNIDPLTKGETQPNYKNPRLWGTLSNGLVDNEDKKEKLKKVQKIPNWQIAYNLQQLSEEVLDPLLREYPNLKIMKGYKSPVLKSGTVNREINLNKHYTGEAVDVFFPGVNMYHYVNDIYQVVKGKVTEVGLVCSGVSWVHLGINGKYGPNEGDVINPRLFSSSDKYVVQGFVPLEGI